MPSRIGKRRSEDDSGDEDNEAEASTSTSARSKKARVNGSGENTCEGQEENGEEQDSEEEEDELDEEDEEMAEEGTQYVTGDSGEAEIGVIEKISLTNFMCHDRLEVNLGAKLNFVIGNNGSGKSAILTAITIALGGKATATSRGHSLKSFVKEGKQTAVVELTLRNTGEEAFKPQQYRNKIIIERMIRADGSGSWKIKSEDRRIISTRREDLNAICDHANIQVDNPMNILTQDSARQFLSSAHSEEKYEFFLKGTQLAQLDAEYEIINLNVNKIRSAIASKEEGLPLLREKAKEANQLLEVVHKVADQRKHVTELRQQLVWASVEEKEAEYEMMSEKIERIKLKIRKINEKLKESLADEKKHETIITELENSIIAYTAREAPVVARMKELKEQEKIHLNTIKRFRDEESTLNGQFVRTNAQLKAVKDRIEAETRKLKDGNEEKRNALLRQHKQAEAERKKLERDEADLRDQMTDLDRQISVVDQDASKLEGKQEQLRIAVADSENMIKTLRGTLQSRLTAYGYNIPTLLGAIDRETRWRQKPLGPIGNHLKLRDARWAGVLESVMGNTLNAFCVTNSHDRNLLQDLKRRHKCDDIPILTGSDEEFDFSHGEPEQEVLTILRVLEIQSSFLTRQLINSLHIEQSALVHARAEGDTLMRQGKRNVKTCYSMDMYRLGGGRVGSSTVSLQQHKGAPRLTSDIDARLVTLQHKYRKDDEELQIVSRSLHTLQDKRREFNEERAQIRQKIPIVQRRARERHAEMERLDEELREDEPISIHALVEARNDFQTQLLELTEKVQKCVDGIGVEERLLQPMTAERMELRKQLESMQDASRSNEPTLGDAATKRLRAHNDWIHWGKELAAQQPKEDDLQASIARCEKELDQMTKAAESHCDRVTAGKSVKSLEKQIEIAEKQLQSASKRHGISVEAISLQVKQYAEAFMKAQAEIQALKEVLKDIKVALNIRLDKWRRFRRMIALRAKNMFDHYLSKRGFRGSLKFDHEKKRLELTIRTEETTNGNQDKDPKSLSGGEKSFATICLLLSLWESIGCPIRCLDEFDVFMDAVNRKISMAMMVEAAKGPHGIQYILITPLGMAGTEVDKDVRAIQLTEPERHQTTLPFSSAT